MFRPHPPHAALLIPITPRIVYIFTLLYLHRPLKPVMLSKQLENTCLSGSNHNQHVSLARGGLGNTRQDTLPSFAPPARKEWVKKNPVLFNKPRKIGQAVPHRPIDQKKRNKTHGVHPKRCHWPLWSTKEKRPDNRLKPIGKKTPKSSKMGARTCYSLKRPCPQQWNNPPGVLQTLSNCFRQTIFLQAS